MELLDVPFQCTIAGDGNDRAMLEHKVKEAALDCRVHFTGFVSDTESLWENCDVLFFPSRWQEPFGLVGLEAMAHSVPVIAFDTGGVREWLSDSENGIIVPEKATVAAGEKLAELCLKHPERLAEMGKKGMEIAKEKFSEENFVKRFRKLAEGLK